MLTSSGSISPVGSVKTYYSGPRRGVASKSGADHSYDSVTFSAAPAGEDAFRMRLVSRLSQDVRTANTTGDIQALRQEVSSGTYEPDPMAIAGKMLFLVGG